MANPATWPRWAALTPHVLAADPAATDNPALRELAGHMCWYLLERGDIRTAHDLASDLHQRWRDRLGEDHEHTLTAAHYLAWTLLEMGRHAESRDLNQDTLARRRRVLGPDHLDTLYSAHNLAINLRKLGHMQAARDLNQDTLARHRRIRGHDHPDIIVLRHHPGPRPARAGRGPGRPPSGRRHLGPPPGHPGPRPPRHHELRPQPGPRPARARLGAGRPRPGPRPLAPRRLILGHDHPDTLASAASPATACATGGCRPPATWTTTPWPAAAGSWANIIPTPFPPPPAWPPTCARSARQMMAHEAMTACADDPIAEFAHCPALREPNCTRAVRQRHGLRPLQPPAETRGPHAG